MLYEIQAFKIWLTFKVTFQCHSRSNLTVPLYSQKINDFLLMYHINHTSVSRFVHIQLLEKGLLVSYHYVKISGPVYPPLSCTDVAKNEWSITGSERNFYQKW